MHSGAQNIHLSLPSCCINPCSVPVSFYCTSSANTWWGCAGLMNIGAMKIASGIPNEGVSLIAEGIVMKQRFLGNEHASVVKAQTNLGQLLDDLGNFEQARLVQDGVFSLNSICIGDCSPQLSPQNLEMSFEGIQTEPHYKASCQYLPPLPEHSLKLPALQIHQQHPKAHRARGSISLKSDWQPIPGWDVDS